MPQDALRPFPIALVLNWFSVICSENVICIDQSSGADNFSERRESLAQARSELAPDPCSLNLGSSLRRQRAEAEALRSWGCGMGFVFFFVINISSCSSSDTDSVYSVSIQYTGQISINSMRLGPYRSVRYRILYTVPGDQSQIGQSSHVTCRISLEPFPNRA